MEILSTVFYFLVTIGILVFVHELGHFLAAKLFRMRVDVFSLGFPPRAFGKKIGDTDYCISWIPVGGYVKIAGMIDESFDTNFTDKPPQPWEFRAKPAWQKVIVLSAGVIMNLLLAIAIFWGIIYHKGRTIHPVTQIGFVTPGSAAEKAGFRANDNVVMVEKDSVSQWDEIEGEIYTRGIEGDVHVRVNRNGTPQDLIVSRLLIPGLSDERFGIFPAGLVPVVGSVERGKPADSIGLAPGDTILAVNGLPVSYGSLPEVIRAHPQQRVNLTWARGDRVMIVGVIPTAEGRIGISLLAGYRGPVVHREYGFFEALPISVREVGTTSGLIIENIYQIIVGKVSLSKSVGGPIRIAQMANRSAESGIVSFLGLLALLSVSLALLNILPFPALDGGHVFFTLYEAAFRREIPVKVKIAIQRTGFILLLAFMAFVIYNDIVQF